MMTAIGTLGCTVGMGTATWAEPLFDPRGVPAHMTSVGQPPANDSPMDWTDLQAFQWLNGFGAIGYETSMHRVVFNVPEQGPMLVTLFAPQPLPTPETPPNLGHQNFDLNSAVKFASFETTSAMTPANVPENSSSSENLPNPLPQSFSDFNEPASLGIGLFTGYLAGMRATEPPVEGPIADEGEAFENAFSLVSQTTSGDLTSGTLLSAGSDGTGSGGTGTGTGEGGGSGGLSPTGKGGYFGNSFSSGGFSSRAPMSGGGGGAGGGGGGGGGTSGPGGGPTVPDDFFTEPPPGTPPGGGTGPTTGIGDGGAGSGGGAGGTPGTPTDPGSGLGATPAPEPASLLLCATAGLLGMGYQSLARRNRKARA